MEKAGKKTTIQISKHNLITWFLIILLTLPHMKPGYFTQIAFLDRCFDFMKVASFLIVLIGVCFFKCRLSIVSILIGAMQAYLVINTVFHQGEVWTSMVQAFSVVSVILLYELVQEEDVFLSAQLFCFELVIYINLITELLYPEGMYQTQNGLFVAKLNWFLGYYNNHSQYYIPALLMAFLYKERTGKKIRVYAIMTVIFASSVLAWSGGVLMGLLSMTIVYVLFKKKSNCFHYYTYWSIHILFFIAIFQLKFQELFRWLLDGVFGKWRSLDVRILLWDRYLSFIQNSLVFGYGVEKGIVRELKSGFHFAMHAHNFLLEIFYQGGIIYFLLMLLIVIIAGKRVYKYRFTLESQIIGVAFLGWCVCTLVEPFTTPFLMGMFVIAYYSNAQKNGEPILETG